MHEKKIIQMQNNKHNNSIKYSKNENRKKALIEKEDNDKFNLVNKFI